MKKRGQAAMEFLMTYGWAILAVIAVIAALAYLGILQLGIGLETCTAQPGEACTAVIEADGDVAVQMTQGTGEDFNNFRLGISDSRLGGNAVCANGGYVTIGSISKFPDGYTTVFRKNTACGTDLSSAAGKRFRTKLIFGYETGSPPLTFNRVGNVVTTVQTG